MIAETQRSPAVDGAPDTIRSARTSSASHSVRARNAWTLSATAPHLARTDRWRKQPAVMAAAMRYAEFGWPVLPCWWLEDGRCACREACSSPGKHPLGLAVRHGLNDATLDRAVIAAWGRCCPKANIAIATGARSGVFVLDLDGHAGERLRNAPGAARAGRRAADDHRGHRGRSQHRVCRASG